MSIGGLTFKDHKHSVHMHKFNYAIQHTGEIIRHYNDYPKKCLNTA